MPRIKRVLLESYTTVNNCYLQDPTFGLVERGLLTTMLSLPDGWHFTIRGLAAILPDGKDRVERSLNKLKDKGYLRTTQVFDDDRRFKDVIYEFCDRPIFLEKKQNKRKGKEKMKEEQKSLNNSINRLETSTASFGEFSPYPENRDPVNRDNNKINKDKSMATLDGDFVTRTENDNKLAFDGEEKIVDNVTVAVDDVTNPHINLTNTDVAPALADNLPSPLELKRIKDLDELRQYVKKKIVVYDFCLSRFDVDADDLDVVVDLLVEMLSSDRQWVKGEYIGIREVRARLCELDAERISCILSHLTERYQTVANQKAYLKTALLNSYDPYGS